MQLDIFEHSRDVILRNEVIEALLRREPEAARMAERVLADEFPSDDALPMLARLIEALADDDARPYADAGALQAAQQTLEASVAPAAQRCFGAREAEAWLLACLRRMAQRAASLPFRAEAESAHAAPLWLRAGDLLAAVEAVAGIESWRRIPAPLGWMAEARFRQFGLDAAWPLLAELAWLAPARFAALVKRLDDPVLAALQRRFDAGFEGEGSSADLAWFPAWALVEKPALARVLGTAQPGNHSEAEQALRLLLDLLHLEHQGRHQALIEQRKRLKSLHGSLYAAYMKTR